MPAPNRTAGKHRSAIGHGGEVARGRAAAGPRVTSFGRRRLGGQIARAADHRRTRRRGERHRHPRRADVGDKAPAIMEEYGKVWKSMEDHGISMGKYGKVWKSMEKVWNRAKLDSPMSTAGPLVDEERRRRDTSRVVRAPGAVVQRALRRRVPLLALGIVLRRRSPAGFPNSIDESFNCQCAPR
eukprot:gene11886-biopygen8977